MNRMLAGLALGAAAALYSASARAQSANAGAPPAAEAPLLGTNLRPMAVHLNVGGFVGVDRTQSAFRMNPEFQYHFSGRYQGPMVGLGLDVLVPGVVLAFTPRFAWDFQLVSTLPLLLAPYAGLSFGGVFSEFVNGFVVMPSLGLDVKFVLLERILLTARPIGLNVPVVSASGVTGAGFAYDLALGVGLLF